MSPLFLPSPGQNVWHLGPLPLRAYALCIIVGIVVGMVIATRRWRARGGTSDGLEAVVVVAVPFGIVGARIYHVITDYELYFGPGRDWVDAFKIWQGGLGIWGAVALGALGGWLVARRRGIRFPALLDAAAPGIAVAQGIGRLGNWFNQELFGRPTTLPWGLEIAPRYRPAGYEQYATFHPTFAYELVWDVAVVAVLLVVLDRRFRLGHGKVFALYVMLYSLGRFWIEALRIDTVNEIGGFRLNNYTSLIAFVVSGLVLLWLSRHRPGREDVVEEGASRSAESLSDEGVSGEGVSGESVPDATATDETGTDEAEDAQGEEAAGDATRSERRADDEGDRVGDRAPGTVQAPPER